MPAQTLTEDAIRNALRDCYDPLFPCNIVDLGLVHAIAIAPDPGAPGTGIPGVPQRHRVHLDLILTSPESSGQSETAAQLTAQLTVQIHNRLAAFETVSHTEITYLSEPRWSPLRISPEGRQRLAQTLPSQPSPLIQITLK